MLTFHSFLQTICQFVKTLVPNVTKRMYRSAAVLTTGLTVVAVVAFTSSSFGAGGKNALAAYEGAPATQEQAPEEDDTEEFDILTQAKIQAGLTDGRRDGQRIVGTTLTKEVQQKQENQNLAKAENEKVKAAIKLKKEEEARIKAEAEAKRKAEEARRQAFMISYSEEDYQVLLKIVQAEAGICDDIGKILVADVIMNRVRSKEFPNNIKDVVYDRYQFSPVLDGTLNTCKVSQQTIDCVNRALNGEDHSGGALYFMYRGASQSRAVGWFDSHLTYLFSRGHHEFFK